MCKNGTRGMGVDIMKKISQFIIKILLIIFIMQFIYIPISNATTWGEIFNLGDEFLELGKEESKNADNGTIDSRRLNTEIGSIYNLLFALGVILSVIVGAIIGIKLMFGGIEEKAKTKEMIAPYVAGCVVIFGAFGIWKLVITVLSNIS